MRMRNRFMLRGNSEGEYSPVRGVSMNKGAGISVWLVAALASAGCTKPIELLWVQATEGASKCTPLVTEDAIIFGNESGYVNAFAKSGVPRWRFTANRDVTATPVVFQNLCFFGSFSSIFHAVDLSTGREAWRFAARERIKSGATILDGTVFFGSYDKHVYALDALTGQLRWKFPGAPPPPVETDAQKKEQEGKASAPPVEKPLETGDFSYARPVVADGVMYVGNLDGNLYALDPKTGAMKWRFKTGAGITSTVWHEGGTLYFGSNDHKLYAIEAASQKVKWTFATGDEVNSSPRISEGLVYVGGVDKRFYAVDPQAGQKKWDFLTKGRIVDSAAFYKNLVFIGSGPEDGNVYALDKSTGKLFWTFPTENKVEADPVVDGNRLYIVAGDGRLFAFQINRTTE